MKRENDRAARAGVTLLLTATVDVGRTPLVARANPSTRLEDYRVALRKWALDESVGSIVFCENSGCDLSGLQDVAARASGGRKRIEFLSFDDRAVENERGKGWGEMRILDHILTRSRLARDNDKFLKVTGRYYVRNATKLIRYLGTHRDVDICCDLQRGMTYCDSRVFGGTVGFLERYVCSRASEIDDSQGIWFEHVLARAVLRAMSDGLRFSLLPCVPLVEGVSGSTNQRFGRSVADRLLGPVKTIVKWYTWLGRLPR
jgi:hypothetical protein